MEIITLPRLTLRPFRRTDGQELWQLLNQEAVLREWGRAKSLEECIHLSLLWEKAGDIRACCLGDQEVPPGGPAVSLPSSPAGQRGAGAELCLSPRPLGPWLCSGKLPWAAPVWVCKAADEAGRGFLRLFQ